MEKLLLPSKNNLDSEFTPTSDICFETRFNDLVCTAKVKANRQTIEQCRVRLPDRYIKTILDHLNQKNQPSLTAKSERLSGLLLSGPFTGSDIVVFEIKGVTGRSMSVELSTESIKRLKKFLESVSLERVKIPTGPVFGL